MRLVIISSDTSGRVALASQQVFGDAAEAAGELGRLVDEGALDLSASHYTFDLDAAVPVVVLYRPMPAAAALEAVGEPFASGVLEELTAEEPESTPWLMPEAPAAPRQDAEAAEEPALAPLEEPAVAPLEEPAVADLAAPELVALDELAPEEAAGDNPAEPEMDADAPEAGAQWPWDLPVIAPEGLVDAAAPVEEPPTEDLIAEPLTGEPVIADEPQIGESVATEQPFEPTAQVPVPEAADAPVAEDEPVAAMPSSAVEGPGAATAVVSEEPAEDVGAAIPVTSQPDEDEPLIVELDAGDPGEPVDPMDAFRVSGGEPEVDDAVAAPVREPTPLIVAEPQSVLDAEAAAAMRPADDGGAEDRVYEPGALNMNEYTCDDCVYVNTCPNQHQKKPAECGSFQWRSV
jgi:hypothetical protein